MREVAVIEIPSFFRKRLNNSYDAKAGSTSCFRPALSLVQQDRDAQGFSERSAADFSVGGPLQGLPSRLTAYFCRQRESFFCATYGANLTCVRWIVGSMHINVYVTYAFIYDHICIFVIYVHLCPYYLSSHFSACSRIHLYRNECLMQF